MSHSADRINSAWKDLDSLLLAELHEVLGHGTKTPNGGDFFDKCRDIVFPCNQAAYKQIVNELLKRVAVSPGKITLNLLRDVLMEFAEHAAHRESSREAMYELCKSELKIRPQKNPPEPDPKPSKTSCHLRRVK